MPTEIGPHLLGRNPSPPDDRDYKLGLFLSADPLDKALAKAMASHLVPKAQKRLDQLIVQALKTHTPPAPTPTPAPPEPPAPADNGYGPLAVGVGWQDPAGTLDQGDTPHCVGFTGADFENLLPIQGHATNDDGHSIYDDCKVVDGEPGAQNGSTIRSLAKVLQRRGRIAAYAFADTVQDIRAWVTMKGAVCMGTDWYEGMFEPDSQGVVRLTGQVVGGHAYTIVGEEPELDAAVCLNHWGPWGVDGSGLFLISWRDVGTLLSDEGEAMAAVELAEV